MRRGVTGQVNTSISQCIIKVYIGLKKHGKRNWVIDEIVVYKGDWVMDEIVVHRASWREGGR